MEGRPTRIKIINGAAPATHEEWAIASIVPMPNLPVAFNTIREILTDFLNDKQIGFSEIEPCPFGKAYIKMVSVFDRDALVSDSPHQFTDVHVVFQPHNKGLNWRRLVVNRDVWILLCGYPFDRRDIQELNNAVNKFGKFLS